MLFRNALYRNAKDKTVLCDDLLHIKMLTNLSNYWSHQEIQYRGRTMILTHSDSSTLMLWTLFQYSFKIFLSENYSWSFYSLAVLLKNIGNSFKALGHLGSYFMTSRGMSVKDENMAFMYKQ